MHLESKSEVGDEKNLGVLSNCDNLNPIRQMMYFKILVNCYLENSSQKKILFGK